MTIVVTLLVVLFAVLFTVFLLRNKASREANKYEPQERANQEQVKQNPAQEEELLARVERVIEPTVSNATGATTTDHRIYIENAVGQTSVGAKAEQILANAVKPEALDFNAKQMLIPEDSTLRRHYLTLVSSMLESITFSRPTDSVLRRHYDHMISSQRDSCLNNKSHMEQLLCNYESHKNSLA